MSKIYTIIGIILLVALLVAFFVLFITRFSVRGASIREHAITYLPKLLSEMFSCDFCLCFWTSLCISTVLVLFLHDISFSVVPIFSTPLARKLL